MGADQRDGPRITLDAFLRARRAGLRPEDVGLPTSGRRRVPGLRREEVATLAGVSTDYYTRLEQGRERHPSAQVLHALARALRLDEEAADHLRRLAPSTERRTRRTRPGDRVGAGLLGLLDRWCDTPALVLGDTLDVLARNGLAEALHHDFAITDNMARMTFLDPRARAFFREWDRAGAAVVAELHRAAGLLPDDDRLRVLVGELSLGSVEFRSLWSRHEVRRKGGGSKLLHHSEVGDLELHYESFSVNDAAGQQLVVYQAEPGSSSEEALALLGSLHSTGRESGAEAARSRRALPGSAAPG
ncbi:helix-turn-helix domain-containing protein [Streptomyces profundus]|uniref:helix-turn-helix domain-containing protein n=1 Tax=Streptomyces profundus TaxID=2867410 RepID=UPI001D166632|nr:helix-turn-helix transcriptional regulator [Streptomyces sp. MA3_2.13]UED85099.1 helix-turn-helix transcriptional regulator [Streptomyces sp. MA3_2.13]